MVHLGNSSANNTKPTNVDLICMLYLDMEKLIEHTVSCSLPLLLFYCLSSVSVDITINIFQRTITEQQRESLATEFKGLNLNKFIQEAVTSIIEAKIKVTTSFVCFN